MGRKNFNYYEEKENLIINEKGSVEYLINYKLVWLYTIFIYLISIVIMLHVVHVKYGVFNDFVIFVVVNH